MGLVGTYLLYYIIVISTSITVLISEALRSRKLKKIGKIVFFISILMPVIVSGYRYGVGTDYFSYERIYYDLTNNYLNVFELISYYRYEPGWIILNTFVKYVFNDPVYVFVISALLTWLFFFKAIYDHKDKISISIAVLIILCTLYNISFNTIRQTLAVSIIILSIKPLLNKQFFKFTIIVLLATCFHYTSLIFMPVYWIVNSKNKKIDNIKKTFAFIGFIGILIFINPILSFVTNIEIFSEYSSYELENVTFSFGAIILRSPVMLLIFLNRKKLRLRGNPMHKIIILYFLGIILLQLGYFGPFVGRIAQYFEVTQALIVGAIIKEMDNKYERFLLAYSVLIYYVAWITYQYLILGRAGTIPYEWIF